MSKYLFLIFGMAFSSGALADVLSTVESIQSTLIEDILPLICGLGLAWAAFSFAMGNPNAKSRAMFVVVGAILGFSAPAIVDWLKALVN